MLFRVCCSQNLLVLMGPKDRCSQLRGLTEEQVTSLFQHVTFQKQCCYQHKWETSPKRALTPFEQLNSHYTKRVHPD